MTATHKAKQNLIPAFPESHRLLEQEGYLFQMCLTSGLTSLRAAGSHDKGKFYSALFNISIGLERLCKAVVIIDRMLADSMKPPSEKEMRNLGHNLIDLHNAVYEIAQRRAIMFPHLSQSDDVTLDIIHLLDDFAKKSRYHNLDSLASNISKADPLAAWHHILAKVIERDLDRKSTQEILSKISAAVSTIEDKSLSLVTGLDGRRLSLLEAFAEPNVQDRALKYVVLRLVRFLSPFKGVLGGLCRQVYSFGGVPAIPQMHEFLEWLWDDRTYVLRKRRWP